MKKIALKYIRTKFKLLSSISKRKAAQEAFNLFITPQQRNTKEPPPVFQQAEKLQFQFNRLNIVGYRWNHPSPKKLLILHGFESSVVNFDMFISPLIEKGYEILAFDAPAHGRSEGKRINALDYKNFVLQIYNTYGPIQSFITHSFGGLALSLALEEIPHDDTYKIAFIAPATESITAIDNFFHFLKLNKELRKEFDQLITNANNKPPQWYSVSRAAGNIRAQVLFLQDKDDELTPFSDVEPIMKRNYPNFHFVISQGLGHRRIYRDDNTIKTILKFF